MSPRPSDWSREESRFVDGESDPERADHIREQLTSSPARAERIEAWREAIREVAESVLNSIEEPEFELISRFAGPVPVVVIARMLGIDEAHYQQFKSWSDLVVQTGFNPSPTPEQNRQALKAKQELDNFFFQQIEYRSTNPGDDLISDMVRAESEGETLSHQEIADQCRLLLVAGNVTTTDLIGNCLKALLENPEQMKKLRDNPSLITNAIEEVLRFDTPVTNTSRVTDREMAVSGCPIEKGESLHLSLAAANRDPEIYRDPDRFDIEREDSQHVAFGGGRHLCLGAHLARVEAQEAINALLDRFPVINYSEKGLFHHSIPAFRGLKELWIAVQR